MRRGKIGIVSTRLALHKSGWGFSFLILMWEHPVHHGQCHFWAAGPGCARKVVELARDRKSVSTVPPMVSAILPALSSLGDGQCNGRVACKRNPFFQKLLLVWSSIIKAERKEDRKSMAICTTHIFSSQSQLPTPYWYFCDYLLRNNRFWSSYSSGRVQRKIKISRRLF